PRPRPHGRHPAGALRLRIRPRPPLDVLGRAAGRHARPQPRRGRRRLPGRRHDAGGCAGARRHPRAAENEPDRCVVSGPVEAIEELRRRFADDGVTGRRLHTSHAFHSPMMDPALPAFAAAVRAVRLSPPSIPFLSNLTGTWITAAQATDPDYWTQHLRQPVRFAAAVEEVFADPRRILLEVGPGRTLATLASRHPRRQGQ